MGILIAETMLKALAGLDELAMQAYLGDSGRANQTEAQKIEMIMGGGAAMVLAHHFPLGTTDIDAIAKGIELSKLDRWVKQVAEEQKIAKDWLNPYFSTYAHTLPSNYGERLVTVFQGSRFWVRALGKEDLLIMKCFAHRQKDVGHSKSLIKQGANTEWVENQIELLQKKGIRGCDEALEFLEDLLE